MPPEPMDQTPGAMSLGEHLEELRRRVIYALIGVAGAGVITFSVGGTLVRWLLEPLTAVLREQGLPPRAYGFTVATGFGVYMRVSLIAALVLAAPWVLLQGWKFIASGLYRSEQRMVMLLTPLSAVMTLTGVLFAYFVMLPVMLIFFIGFTASYPRAEPGTNPIVELLASPIRQLSGLDDATPSPERVPDETASAAVRLPLAVTDPEEPVEGQVWVSPERHELRIRLNGRTHAVTLTGDALLVPQIEVGGYISDVLMLVVGIVVAFQVPVVLLVLGMTGLIDPAVIARSRRYVVFGLFVLAAFLTPADPISMLVLGLPLWGLFELGMLLMKQADRRRAAQAAGRPL